MCEMPSSAVTVQCRVQHMRIGEHFAAYLQQNIGFLNFCLGFDELASDD